MIPIGKTLLEALTCHFSRSPVLGLKKAITALARAPRPKCRFAEYPKARTVPLG